MKEVIFENSNTPYYTREFSLLSANPHFHKELEFIYSVEGSAIIHADQKKQYINAGDLCVVFPNQIHYYENLVDGKYIVIVVSYDHLFNLKTLFRDFVPENHVINLKEKGIDESVIFNCLTSVGEYAKTAQLGYINIMVSKVLPLFELTTRTQTKNTTINKVFDYCTENFRENISLSSVAEAIYVSKYHISKLLNTKIMLSFSNYINLLRIQEACRLLVDTNKSVIDISESIGFGSVRSFNRAFIKFIKMTPTEYRRLHTEKQDTMP